MARVHSRLTDAPLSVEAAYGFCTDPRAGAVVLFTGTVRDHADGRDVAGLTYEAFAERAEAQLAELAARVGEHAQTTCAVWMEHRVGVLAVGEPAVVVAVSAEHRAEAFEAARYGIDALKDEVAIWKQEHWLSGGSHWPGSD